MPLNEDEMEEMASSDGNHAQMMLDRWHGENATRYRLIVALIKAEEEHLAEEVFGDNVHVIEQLSDHDEQQ